MPQVQPPALGLPGGDEAAGADPGSMHQHEGILQHFPNNAEAGFALGRPGPGGPSRAHSFRIGAVTDVLPPGFGVLQTAARAEDHRMLDRLAADWDTGHRFDQAGEALLAAWHGDALAGVGGITLDPAVPGALRLRRFYVHPSQRRLGVGRALAAALLGAVRQAGTPVLVNAGTPAAAVFWEGLGLVPDPGASHTHRLPATPMPPPAPAAR